MLLLSSSARRRVLVSIVFATCAWPAISAHADAGSLGQRIRAAAQSIFSGKRWGRPGARADRGSPSGVRYWRLRFFDDFKGRPSASERDQICYDRLPAQCHIWGGGDSYRCDLAHLPLSDASMIPPLRENLGAALNTVDRSRDWRTATLPDIKTRYAQVVAERTRHLDKCTWTAYHMLNWMSTDYQGRWAARFDPLMIRVLPQGPGYLELSAAAAPIAARCPRGGKPITAGSGRTPDLCKVSELAANVPVRPGVSYWIDADPRWAGLYYAAQNGACPHGGTLAGPNCSVTGFEAGLLDSDIKYQLRGRDVVYWAVPSERCAENIQYLPNAVKFRPLACSVLNGGLMSNHFNPQMGGPMRGFSQQYGRFEAKMRIVRGEGAFPAAWLMPLRGAWPYSGGEIDIIEARDNADEAYQTYHHGKCYRAAPSGGGYIEALTYYNAQGQESLIDSNVCGGASTACVGAWRHTNGSTGRNPPGNCAGGAYALRDYTSMNVSVGHTTKGKPLAPLYLKDTLYSVEWTPNRLDYFVDAEHSHTVAVGTKPTANYATGGGQAALPPELTTLGAHNFPTDPFYFILNHSTWVRPERRAGFQPQRILIDYIKAYSACTNDSELCPCGGRFVEGRGCMLSGTINCPRGEPPPAVSQSPQGGVYASPCTRIDIQKPGLGATLATAAAALKDIVARKLRAFAEGFKRALAKVATFFDNLRHWLERYDPCVRDHVKPRGTKLGQEVAAAARSEMDAFWREAIAAMQGLSSAEKVQLVTAPWNELLADFRAKLAEARAKGVPTVRGWFNKGSHKNGAEAAFGAAFDAVRSSFEAEAGAAFASHTK
jgi:hypothetical protein